MPYELSLSPADNKPKSNKNPRPAQQPFRSKHPISRRERYPTWRLRFLPVLFILLIVAVQDKFSLSIVENRRIKTIPIPLKSSTPDFVCSGKVYCSEMNSYEEALFYLHNCSGTKMDGDNNGDPCERQFQMR